MGCSCPPPPCEIIVLSVYNWSGENARIRRINIHENHPWNLFRYQSIKITWLPTIFIDFDFYLFATLGCIYTRNFERVAGLNREKLGNFKPGQYQPSEEDLNLVLKKRWDFLKDFFKKRVRVIVWSLDYQLQLNHQQIYCLHGFSFHFLMSRWTKCIFRYNRYQSNQIHRFLSIYRLINRYWFLLIDYSGLI